MFPCRQDWIELTDSRLHTYVGFVATSRCNSTESRSTWLPAPRQPAKRRRQRRRELVTVDPPPSDLNKTLPAFAAERRRHAARRSELSIDICCRRQQQTRRPPLLQSIDDGTDRQTYGWTPNRYIDSSPHTMWAVSITTEKNYTRSRKTSWYHPLSCLIATHFKHGQIRDFDANA